MSRLRTEDSLGVPKYIVYRTGEKTPLNPAEYFVIKSSDVFGPAALHGYAHLIQTLLELARTRPVLSDEECEELAAYVDALSSRAIEWQTSGRGHLPD